MKNVETAIKGNTLTVTVDISKTFGPSKSGKTIIIGTSEGNQKIETPAGEIVMGLNVYKKAS